MHRPLTRLLTLSIALLTLALVRANAEDRIDLDKLAPAKYHDAILAQLKAAGANRSQLIDALQAAPEKQREGLAFLIANMPPNDLQSLSKNFLLTNLRFAYQARTEVPWGGELPDELFLNDVLPYAGINERRDDWRQDFYDRFLPIAKKCKTPGEAALLLNKEVFRQFDVQYSATKRPKPDQSPYESAQAKFASCTGLSVLAVDAFRAVSIPARLAGTPLWTDRSGNHTWVEAWDGSWHVLGASESTQLDQTWFNDKAAQADPAQPLNRIYATSFARTEASFPLVWDLSNRSVPAIDVTACYKARHNVGFKIVDTGGRPAAAAVTLRLNGRLVAAGSGKSAYTFLLAGGLTYEAELQAAGKSPHVEKIELPKEGSPTLDLRLGKE
jgi:hypothetical protein